MDRISRKELKTDKFAEDVFDIFAWTTEHKGLVLRYGAMVAGVAVVVLAVFGYMHYQAGAREDAMTQASQIADATVGAENTPGLPHYATQDAKDQALQKSYADIANKYSGSVEGSIAEMALASDAATKGNMADAERRYKGVVDHGPKSYAALARLALGQVYVAEGKTADAQKVLQEAVDSPTDTVSKEQATIALAQVIAKTNPQEATKMLDKLRSASRSAVSVAATTAYGEVQASTKK